MAVNPAALAYTAYAEATGATTTWSELAGTKKQAWWEVVKALMKEIGRESEEIEKCSTCGDGPEKHRCAAMGDACPFGPEQPESEEL